VPPAKLVLLDLLARLEKPARMVVLALLAVPAMLVPLEDPAKLVVLVHPEKPARLAQLAAANTAHQLVWLQVIKRRRLLSHAVRQIRRRLGRFVKKIVHDYDLYLVLKY